MVHLEPREQLVVDKFDAIHNLEAVEALLVFRRKVFARMEQSVGARTGVNQDRQRAFRRPDPEVPDDAIQHGVARFLKALGRVRSAAAVSGNVLGNPDGNSGALSHGNGRLHQRHFAGLAREAWPMVREMHDGKYTAWAAERLVGGMPPLVA